MGFLSVQLLTLVTLSVTDIKEPIQITNSVLCKIYTLGLHRVQYLSMPLFNIDNHIKQIYRKAGNKLNALTRTINVISPFQKVTFKSFIKGKFNYCLLLWVFCSHSSNKRINKIHERALHLTFEINKILLSKLIII